MLKLTSAIDRTSIFIAPAHIVGLISVSKGTQVITVASWQPHVLETRDEIMAMPQMARHFMPLVTMPPLYAGGPSASADGLAHELTNAGSYEALPGIVNIVEWSEPRQEWVTVRSDKSLRSLGEFSEQVIGYLRPFPSGFSTP
jgi:hypothetical protein